MGCDQSVPVQETYPGNRPAHRPGNRPATTNNNRPRPANQRQGATHNPATQNRRTGNRAAGAGGRRATAQERHKASMKVESKKEEIRKNIERKKQTDKYKKRQTALKKEKSEVFREKAMNNLYPSPPPANALKRDINEYKHKSPKFEDATDGQKDEAQFLRQAEELIPADVIMISGCEDGQTSADVMNAGSNLPDPKGKAAGAATSALLGILYKHKGEDNITFQDTLMALREKLQQQGHSQIPQLTSSRPLDIDAELFTLHNKYDNNGVRRAVLVGINYVGQQGQLRGCHHDAYHMKDYLVKVHHYEESNITMLTDDGTGEQPTKQKMIAALKQLVDVSQPGDDVFFHYSGHGGFLEADQNSFKQKNDHYDQTLIPLDHRRAGQIRDFNLFNEFVRPMRSGVRVTCLMDCCHSGSVLDLPYSYKPTEEGKGPYRQQMNFSDMAGLLFLSILAGEVLDSLLFGDCFDCLNATVGTISMFEGLYADLVYNDLTIEELVEKEIEQMIEKEVIEQLVGEAIEKEVEKELMLMFETEIQKELEREVEAEITREIENELERELENAIDDLLDF